MSSGRSGWAQFANDSYREDGRTFSKNLKLTLLSGLEVRFRRDSGIIGRARG